MDRRTEIIQEAFHLFEESGPNFRISDLATNLHIAKKTMYKHFASKEDLLIGMLDTAYEDIHAAKREIMSSDLPYLEKVREMMVVMPEPYELMDLRASKQYAEQYPRVAAALKEHLETDWEPVIALLEKGIDSGELKNFNIPVFQAMFTASIERFIATSVLNDSRISYKDGLRMMMDILMDGITAN